MAIDRFDKRTFIDVTDDSQLNFITRTWGCSKESLLLAIEITNCNERRVIHQWLIVNQHIKS